MDLELIRWDRSSTPQRQASQSELEGEGYAVISWSDGPCVEYQPHQHDEDESLWLLEGEMTFVIAGKEYALAVGDRLLLPAGTEHSALAGRDGAAYLVGKKK